jgi:hypothetical protein
VAGEKGWRGEAMMLPGTAEGDDNVLSLLFETEEKDGNS